jgi:hypothetical protein
MPPPYPDCDSSSHRVCFTHRQDKIRFMHEWVRLHGGENKLRVYDQSPENRNNGGDAYHGDWFDRDVPVSYYKRVGAFLVRLPLLAAFFSLVPRLYL